MDLPHALIATTSLWADILPNTSSMPVSIPKGSAYGITPGIMRATICRKKPIDILPAAKSPITSFTRFPTTSTKTNSATVIKDAAATCFNIYLFSVPIISCRAFSLRNSLPEQPIPPVVFSACTLQF